MENKDKVWGMQAFFQVCLFHVRSSSVDLVNNHNYCSSKLWRDGDSMHIITEENE